MSTHAWVVWIKYGAEPWRLDAVVYTTRAEARQNARLIRSGAPDSDSKGPHRMKNNYVRIGFKNAMDIIVFDDTDPIERRRVASQVEVLRQARGRVPIAMWCACTDLSYPVVGEPTRMLPREYLN